MKKLFTKKEATIPFTKEGYQKILEEKAKLLSQRPEAVEHLRRAREMGDLSENGYYKASRARLSFLDSRIRRVERLVRLGVIVQSSRSGMVDIGSKVKITDGKKQYIYEIVGGYESDPSKNTISHQSPIGRALMGKKENETAIVLAPSGAKKYTILSVNR
ncbi:transcription elongation factor GreA [Candidatus Gottesmanbacteria bacterium]|nr:transcription elongation factor GreA [Candidatus Gottesmanbacteria bacterium]